MDEARVETPTKSWSNLTKATGVGDNPPCSKEVMLPDYILRRGVESGGVRLTPLTVKVDGDIYAKIRKEHSWPIPKGNRRAQDYRTALTYYVHHKMMASRMEKHERCSMTLWLHHKQLSAQWRDVMDRIEFGLSYTMLM